MARVINIHTGEDRVIEKKPATECTICKSEFDIKSEGGTSGYLGMLWIAFCPFCLSGLLDMTKQLLGIEDGEEEEKE